MNWKTLFTNKKSAAEFIITIIILILTLSALTNFLKFVEVREGVVLPDPLLAFFSPVNLTWLTFGIIYISLFSAVIILAKHPAELLLLIQSYTLMIIVRMIAMYLVPLNPPKGMILLVDPFVEFFGTGITLTKDLFFSGHTATLFLLYLVSNSKSAKKIFLVSTIIVGFTVLIQHVHYSLDVITAPFFAYGTFRIIYLLRGKYSSIQN